MQTVPGFTLENRFDAPPDYVQKWLCDYRPDDGRRYFGDKGPDATVTRKGDLILRESEAPPLGRQHVVVKVESPTRWGAKGDFKKGGKVTAVFRITETVRADGAGTLHHVQGTMEGKTLGTRLMLPLMMPMMKSGLRKAFAKMKVDMEGAHKEGKPPTA